MVELKHYMPVTYGQTSRFMMNYACDLDFDKSVKDVKFRKRKKNSRSLKYKYPL